MLYITGIYIIIILVTSQIFHFIFKNKIENVDASMQNNKYNYLYTLSFILYAGSLFFNQSIPLFMTTILLVIGIFLFLLLSLIKNQINRKSGALENLWFWSINITSIIGLSILIFMKMNF